MSKPSTFRWTFEPKNLFRLGDDEIKYEFDCYRLVIRDGEAEAVVPDLRIFEGWPNVHDIRKAVQHGVERILDSQAIWEHETYKLNPDGYDIPESLDDDLDEDVVLRNLTLKAKAVAFFEIEFRGPDGEITYDSKKARKQHSRELGTLVYHHADDPWASFIISRYQNAISDPDREFVHLFDIVNAMENKFDSRQAARTKCKVTKSDLNELTTLANDAPVRQGRHPGKKVEDLRDATEEERKVARQVARQLIFGYLTYLANDES